MYGCSTESAHPLSLLCLRDIRKTFPGVVAVSEGNFELNAGEIHAPVGENGAGKSTLIKALTGAHQPDSGQILLHDQPVTFDSPLKARHAGIAAIYQELSLIPGLTVRENLFLGREKSRAGFVDRKEENRQAQALFSNLGVDIDPNAGVVGLDGSYRPRVKTHGLPEAVPSGRTK
jgi:ABC-type sugar transport system ATPase subunit